MKLFAEQRRIFPDPRLTPDDGLVAMGDDLSPSVIIEAYSFGIFPWPHPDVPLLWFSPDPRAILEYQSLHLSRSLQKYLRKTKMTVSFNQNFEEVMKECASVSRPGQYGTWITPELTRAYIKMHELGYVHSVECWLDGILVGGLYGTYIAGVFSGESMFHKTDNASKFCVIQLMEKLKNNGLAWMDIQMLTPHMKALGAREIPRNEFLSRIEERKAQLKIRRPQGAPLSFV